MDYVQGDILTSDGFVFGHLGFTQEGVIEQGNKAAPKQPVAEGLILPGLVNMHTHIGDSFIRNKNVDLPHSVDQLVAPPNGLKYQLFEQATDDEIIQGMTESIQTIKQTGVFCFCDFREQGIQGIAQLKNALQTQPMVGAVIFGRPKELSYNAGELRDILNQAQGIGVSSISDWDYPELKKIAHETHQHRHKLFVLHASETVREDIDLILDLHPDILVHMTQATEADLVRVKQEDIPIVLCPRSNDFFGLHPPFNLLKKTGVRLLLGTDNAMMNPPNILEEILFLKHKNSGFSLVELLHMITYSPRKVLNEEAYIQVPNLSAGFVVLERENLKPIYISQYKRGIL